MQPSVTGPVTVCELHEILLRVDGVVGMGYTVITAVFLCPRALPEIVTSEDTVTAEETALNPAVFAPVATVTDAGRDSTPESLLANVTTVGLVAGVLRETEQAFVWGPIRDCVPQEIWLSAADVPEKSELP